MKDTIVIKIGGVASQNLSQDFLAQVKNGKMPIKIWSLCMVVAMLLIN